MGFVANHKDVIVAPSRTPTGRSEGACTPGAPRTRGVDPCVEFRDKDDGCIKVVLRPWFRRVRWRLARVLGQYAGPCPRGTVRQTKELAMSENRRADAVPGAITDDSDDERDLPGERLDDDFDIASAREQDHEQRRHGAAEGSAAPEVVDGS